MSDKRVLRIHTHLKPPENTAAAGFRRQKKPRRFHTPPASAAKADMPDIRRIGRSRPRPTYTDRLMRNSAIACALILGILTLTNLDSPWARKAVEGVEQALTMRIDLDDTIGELTFVKELMPESALVFLNISGKDQLEIPVEGELTHPWCEVRPWMMFACRQGAPVIAADDGVVTAVSPLSDGKTGILVDHGSGAETVYACLESASVASGDTVSRGQTLGDAGEYLYFEWRINGASSDPTQALGL